MQVRYEGGTIAVSGRTWTSQHPGPGGSRRGIAPKAGVKLRA